MILQSILKYIIFRHKNDDFIQTKLWLRSFDRQDSNEKERKMISCGFNSYSLWSAMLNLIGPLEQSPTFDKKTNFEILFSQAPL